MRKSIIFTLIVVIGFYLTGYAFADDKALESEIYYDKNTGLEWLAGPDKPTNWNEAKKWVRSLADISDGGWRMPTIEMLKTLYNKAGKCNIKPFLKPLDVGYGLEKPRIPLRLGAMTTLTHAVAAY